MATKVSIILPVWKAREDWLEQCIDSIMVQTYPNIEVIRVDDVEGAWKARNEGLKRATGDYIAFCDADDYMEPDAIEKMVKAIEGVDMVCGSFRKFGNFEMTVTFPECMMENDQVAAYVMANLLNPRINQMLSGCWAKLYRRGLCGKFPELVTAEDMAFNFDYLWHGHPVRFIPDVVYHNRKHSDSLSTRYDGTRGLFDFLGGLKHVGTFLKCYYRDEEVNEALDISKVYHSMLYAQRIGVDALKKVFP